MRKVGLALSGGGARGIAHLGVVQAIQEAGIDISTFSGTSSGAIVAVFLAKGYAPKEILEIFTTTSFLRKLRPAIFKKGWIDWRSFAPFFTKYLGDALQFDQLNKKVIIAATNILSGKADYFTEGLVMPAMMASSTVPILFAPVSIANMEYVDGGLTDNLPVKPLLSHSDYIIASHSNPIAPISSIKGTRKLIERSLLIAIKGNTEISKPLADVFIEPFGMANSSSFNLQSASFFYAQGYASAKEKLKGITLE